MVTIENTRTVGVVALAAAPARVRYGSEPTPAR
jgi:hypothetical protein